MQRATAPGVWQTFYFCADCEMNEQRAGWISLHTLHNCLLQQTAVCRMQRPLTSEAIITKLQLPHTSSHSTKTFLIVPLTFHNSDPREQGMRKFATNFFIQISHYCTSFCQGIIFRIFYPNIVQILQCIFCTRLLALAVQDQIFEFSTGIL